MDEPCEGSVVADDGGHEWRRCRDGRWRCTECPEPPGLEITWGWDEVEEDSTGELRMVHEGP